MASTTRRFTRILMTTVFASSAIPDLLTIPHREELVEVIPHLGG
jgi:hypothetical protein